MKTHTIRTDNCTITLSPATDDRILEVRATQAVVATQAHRRALVAELRAWGVVAPSTYVRVQA